MTTSVHRLTAALADRYRIEREIGAGGMATVYLAHDLRHDRDVAIKVLHPDLGAALGSERFLSEIRTTARLQHPHILPLLDSGEADGLLFYVMPLVSGETLRARLERERQLPVDDAVRIAREVADALGHAHGLGVVHRDVKPENILLQGGHALVADFGIALAVQQAGGQRMTQTGLSLGTPQYMSPEQAMGERTVDARSDIYALGAVTYEMLVGEPPFSGPTVQAVVARLMAEEPRPISVYRKAVPDGVEAAVLRALEKLPADRFASAGAFSVALGDRAGGAVRRTGTGVNSSPRKKATRAMLLALVGAGLLLTGGIGATLLRPGQPAASATARVQLQLPVGEELRAERLPMLTTPPGADGFLYHGPGLNTRTQLWFRRWDELHGRRLSQSLGESCCAAYSPSGDTLAYLSAPGQLNLLPLTGGVPVALPDFGLISVTDFGGGLDWGPDGRLYAIAPEGLVRIDVGRAAKEVVAGADSARGSTVFLWPQVLPGARAAIVTVIRRETSTDPERASIGIANFGTGRVEILGPGVRAIYSPTGHLIVARANGVLWALPFDGRTLRANGSAIELRDTVALRFGSASPGVADFSLDAAGNLSYVAGRDGAFDLKAVDRTGASSPLAQDQPFLSHDAMATSPDGRRLVVAIASADLNVHLWIQPLNGGPRVRLTFDGNTNIGPQWRPGAGSISWSSNRESPGSILLWLYERDADGRGQPRRLATGDSRAVSGHAWSPDGRWLVFRTDDQERGSGDIMGFRPGQDTVARPLVATPAEELAPAVSPDGRWLAYTSNESGRREVYVSPFPETSEGRYQVSTAGGMTPAWRPDGRELFFVDDAQRMVAVPVTTGPGFQAGAPAPLFQTEDYYLAPFRPQYALLDGGRRFIMARREGGSSFAMVVAFNFLRELREMRGRN